MKSGVGSVPVSPVEIKSEPRYTPRRACQPVTIRGHDVLGRIPSVPGSANHRALHSPMVRRERDHLDNMHVVLSDRATAGISLRPRDHAPPEAPDVSRRPSRPPIDLALAVTHHPLRPLEANGRDTPCPAHPEPSRNLHRRAVFCAFHNGSSSSAVV